jgi:hypothetical protein
MYNIAGDEPTACAHKHRQVDPPTGGAMERAGRQQTVGSATNQRVVAARRARGFRQLTT